MRLRTAAILWIVVATGTIALADRAFAHPNDLDTWPQFRGHYFASHTLTPAPEQPVGARQRSLAGQRAAQVARARDAWETFDSAYWTKLANEAARVSAHEPAYESVGTTSWADPYCESGGNIHALSPSGTYYGKWQYDYPSWVEDGGDPACYRARSCSEAEQDAAAANAPFDRWPNC